MISININPQTAVPMIVGVGSTILAVLLMLIKIPDSDYSSKLSNSKLAIVVSFLICGFMMFFSMGKYGDQEIKDWDMFLMLSIYIVVHFSTTIISYSMTGLLGAGATSGKQAFTAGLFLSAVLSFLLLDAYRSVNMTYFWIVFVFALFILLLQSVTYIINFKKAYRNSLVELEKYYDEDEGYRIRWVRFCYIISMLSNLFVLVYLFLYWFLDYKMEVASVYTIWYLLYMLYLTSNFISFIGSHKIVLDAFAHKALSRGGEMTGKGKKDATPENEPVSPTVNEAEFARLERSLEVWVAQKNFREYGKSREEVAKEMGTTKEILHHYFTVKKGVDFKSWRTELRIDEAKRLLLKDKTVSINIVAEMSGFSDRSNFHRQFVKIVGCSPKQWRDSGGNPDAE